MSTPRSAPSTTAAVGTEQSPGHRRRQKVVQHRFRDFDDNLAGYLDARQPRHRTRWQPNDQPWSWPPSSPYSAGWRLRSSTLGRWRSTEGIPMSRIWYAAAGAGSCRGGDRARRARCSATPGHRCRQQAPPRSRRQVPRHPSPASAPTRSPRTSPPACSRRRRLCRRDPPWPKLEARPAGRRGFGRHLPARSRNPLTGKIEGFDIRHGQSRCRSDLRDEDRYQLKVITAAQRFPRSRRARSTSSPGT